MRVVVLATLCVSIVASSVVGQETVRDFSWSTLKESGQLTVGEIVPGDGSANGQEQLKIENPGDEPKTVTLLDLEKPGITSLHYAVEGRVRYENVQGKSYLEVWNWFADGGKYFSRSLGPAGPMQPLEGSSDWRPFTLPFFSSEMAGMPTRIIVNVVFVGRGTVYLSPLKLAQYTTGPWSQPGVWWTVRTGAWIGTIGGCSIGLLGAVFGILAGLGKARRLVLAVTVAMIGIGVMSLALGLVALALKQPYAVYFPLLLIGMLLTVICGANYPTIRRRYEQIELRKMMAKDSA